MCFVSLLKLKNILTDEEIKYILDVTDIPESAQVFKEGEE